MVRAGGLQLWRRSLVPGLAITAVGWASLLAAFVAVVSRCEAAYCQLSIELPALTLDLITTERFIAAWWWLLPLVGSPLLLLLLYCCIFDHRSEILDRLLLGLPWIGRVLRMRLHCSFLRAIASRMQAGGEPASAVAESAVQCRNRAVRSQIAVAASRVAAGTNPVLVLAECIGFLGAATAMVPPEGKGAQESNLAGWCSSVADGLEAAADDASAGFNRFAIRLNLFFFGIAALVFLAGLAMPALSHAQDHRQYS